MVEVTNALRKERGWDEALEAFFARVASETQSPESSCHFFFGIFGSGSMSGAQRPVDKSDHHPSRFSASSALPTWGDMSTELWLAIGRV